MQSCDTPWSGFSFFVRVRRRAMTSFLLQAYHHNRRKTNGVGRIAARVIEQLVACQLLTMRSLIHDTRRCGWLGPALASLR